MKNKFTLPSAAASVARQGLSRLGAELGGDKYRHDRRGRGQALAVLEPDGMRDYLLSHPLSRGGRLWCDRVLQGVDRGERSCLRLYAEALKWVGAQTNLVAVFVQALGVRDESELKTLVESGRRLERLADPSAVSLEHYRDEAVELLRMVLMEYPEWRGEVLVRLGDPVGVSENGESA